MKKIKYSYRGSRKSGYLVEFSIENQKFTLDAKCATLNDVKWFHKMLRKAFKTLLS